MCEEFAKGVVYFEKMAVLVKAGETLERRLNDFPVPLLALADALVRLDELALTLHHGQGAPHHGWQKLDEPLVLHHVIKRTLLHHFDGGPLIAMSRNDDKGKLAPE